MGVDSEFSTSELGVRESAKSCTSAYSSYGSLTIDAAQGANVLGFKQYSECDDANKTFLSNPDPTLPAIVTLPDGTTDWLYAPTIKPTVLSILSYTHKVGDPSMAGTIAGSVENYRGNVTMRIDVDGDGKFNGANDRNVTIGTKGGVVSYAWDGKDAKGNAVPVGTNISFRLDADRKGEIHFARWDIEQNNEGIVVNRIRGQRNVKPTWLYWDDSRLGAAGVCGTRSITPIDNSVTGVDSVSGVHSWDNKGCASNGNGELTNNDSSWGNNRLLDDWTYDSAAATDSLVLTVKPELYVTKVADKKDVKRVKPLRTRSKSKTRAMQLSLMSQM